MGRIVHTKGSIGRTGVAQGAICKTCPGGCKTDCLRAGVTVEETRLGKYNFSISFNVNNEVSPLPDDEGWW